MKLPNHVEHWDDERNIDNGVIVTLKFGWSFEPDEHQGVKGFDTGYEAREAVKLKNIHRCTCEKCKGNKGKTTKEVSDGICSL